MARHVTQQVWGQQILRSVVVRSRHVTQHVFG